MLKADIFDDPSGALFVDRTGQTYYVHDAATRNRVCCVIFQDLPIQAAGVNGASIEAILAICIDRLNGFVDTGHTEIENVSALRHLREALADLNQRTTDRMERGVEGSTEP